MTGGLGRPWGPLLRKLERPMLAVRSVIPPSVRAVPLGEGLSLGSRLAESTVSLGCLKAASLDEGIAAGRDQWRHTPSR